MTKMEDRFKMTLLPLLSLILVLRFSVVQSDVTVRTSASQSHPMEGHSTALTCEVRSLNQSQVVIWSKDQMSITWGDDVGPMMSSRFQLIVTYANISGDNMTMYKLIINDVTRDDDGRYQCQVLRNNGNGYSAMASATVILSILYFPARGYPYCSHNGSQTLLTGTELTITCVSEVGNPQISSVWTVEGYTTAPLPYRTAQSPDKMVSKLDLIATWDLQGANVTCRVTSPAFGNEEQTCTFGPLRILELPIVTITRSSANVSEGDDVYFLCSTTPSMPEINWVTFPKMDAERMMVTENGSLLIVKNVRAGDNATNVVCQVPYRDTNVEARSVILLHKPNSTHPSGPTVHATSQLCVPWFGAFLFAVAVNIVLCLIILGLIVKVRRLSSKLVATESDADSLNGIDTGMMERRNKALYPDGLARHNSFSNWSMVSEKDLTDERTKSWQTAPERNRATTKRELGTYTELSPDTVEKPRPSTRPKPLRKAVSLQEVILLDGDSYMTPNSRVRLVPKVITLPTGSEPKRKPNLTKTPASKTSSPGRKPVKTISGTISGTIFPPPVLSPDNAKYLHEKANESGQQRSTYQALQKSASLNCVRKPSVSSQKKSPPKSALKPNTEVHDMMDGESGDYIEAGSYMEHGEETINSKLKQSKSLQRQDSMTDDGASYMGLGATKTRSASQTNGQKRSANANSKNSEDSSDARYEIPPDAGTVDDMGEGIYTASQSIKKDGKRSARGTVSSRTPMPDPTSDDRQDPDNSSTDGSYREPYQTTDGNRNPEYFTLEPDQESYTNYGADISSDSECYQGAETLDWDPDSEKTVTFAPDARRKISTASEASYLELEDDNNVTSEYMDMTKVKTMQQKRVSKRAGRLDSEDSSDEYYQMEKGTYSVPPSNKLKVVVEEPNLENAKEPDKQPIATGRKQKKKRGWGPFKKS